MTPADRPSLYRRAGACALLAAPVLLLADNLVHPRELAPGHEAEQLAVISQTWQRWQLAHLLGFAAIVVFAAGIAALAFLVSRRQPRLGLAGGALGIAGLLGLSGAIALDGFAWGVLGQAATRPGVDRETLEQVLALFQGSPWPLPFYALGLAYVAGLALLGIAAWQARTLPRWASGALVLGALLVGTETLVISNVYFVAGAAVMLVGAGGAGVAMARMSDDQFAAGGPGSLKAKRQRQEAEWRS